MEGGVTTAACAYMAEEYGRATYYWAQAEDTAGVVENATCTGVNVAIVGLSAYN